MKTQELTAGPNDTQVEIIGDETLADGPISYGHLTSHRPGASMFVPALLSGSDYSGTLVERSNYNVFAEAFARGEGVWWAHTFGGHGTFGVVIDPAKVPADDVTEVAEFLGGLHDYPIADEEAHSAAEAASQDEAWQNWVRAEFVREVEQCFDVCLDNVTDDAVYELFQAAWDAANESWVNEQGDSSYINVERVVLHGVTEADVKELLTKTAAAPTA